MRIFLIFFILFAMVYASNVFSAEGYGEKNISQHESAIPFKKPSENKQAVVGRVVLGFLFVVTLAFLFLLVLKKTIYKKFTSLSLHDRIQVVEKKSLSPKLAIFLVLVDDQEYLLSNDGSHSTLLKHGHNLVGKDNSGVSDEI